MDSFIIPNVEFSNIDIPSRPFFRNTKKLSLKVTDEGIVFNGRTLLWTDITDVKVKFFESNPYISIIIGREDETFNFFFENKFYYRKKAPWFGGSEYITTEFVKILEEKNLFTVQKLKAQVESEERNYLSSPLVHTLWNISFFVFPIIILLISIAILYVGLNQNGQIQLL